MVELRWLGALAKAQRKEGGNYQISNGRRRRLAAGLKAEEFRVWMGVARQWVVEWVLGWRGLERCFEGMVGGGRCGCCGLEKKSLAFERSWMILGGHPFRVASVSSLQDGGSPLRNWLKTHPGR